MSVAVAVASHTVAAFGFLGLFVALASRARTPTRAPGLALACLATGAWAAMAALGYASALGETVRTAAWAGLLLMLLGPASAYWKVFVGATAALCLLSISTTAPIVQISARLMLSVMGMLLVEQVYRNTRPSERWAIKFACIGIGAIFSYDFFLYSDAAMFRSLNADILAARGIANALAVPLLAIAARRRPRWTSGVAVSRKLVFHSAALIGSAVYVLAMATSGYYLRFVGGDWGRVMQLAFLCGSGILLAGVLFSGAMRARVKVLINKHLYNQRFDYREEWLRFTRVLSADGEALGERSIAAIAGMVESPAGALWLRRDADRCEPAAAWNMAPQRHILPCDSEFFRFIEARQWVVDVGECLDNPQRYPDLPMPPWLLELPQIWLVVPLMLHGRLFGIVALAAPRTRISLDWEVIDVLKIAGSQAASYLAHRESLNSLMVARQFESFNRMSTFIVHDLKNLVFQFSLLLANAEKHQHNPAFQADVLSTLGHSVQKMKTLLQRLARGETHDVAQPLLAGQVVERAVQAMALAEPRPQHHIESADLVVLAHRSRLERVLGHLIQNAVDACARDGSVTVRLARDGDSALIEVIDNGKGMSQQFIAERLFKPFESTKSAGMGIGAFESRAYIHELGGQLEVASTEQRGTTFRVRLPLHINREIENGQKEAVGD